MSKPIVLGNSCTPVVHNRYVCGALDYLVTSLELDNETGTLYLYQNPDNCLQIQIPAILDQQRVAELIEGFAQNLENKKLDKTYKLLTTNGIQGGGNFEFPRTLSIKPNDDHIDVSEDGLRIRQFDTVTTSGTVVSPREIEADSEHFLNALNEWVTIDRESNLSIGERTDSSLEIVNDYGTGIVIPAVDNTYAGLATPKMLNYIDIINKENLVVEIGDLNVSNTGFTLGYQYINNIGTKTSKQINFPVVTDTTAGLITPEILNTINTSSNEGIRHIEGVTNTNNYTITSKDYQNGTIDTVVIPLVSEALPGLMTSEQATIVDRTSKNRYLKNVTKSQVDDGFVFNYEYYNTSSDQTTTESIKIPLAGTEGYPGLITAEEKQRIEDFAFRDAVIKVVGNARPDSYQLNVEYRNGAFETYRVPVVDEIYAGVVTSEMYKNWEDLRARVDVVDVTSEQNANEYDLTIHYSDGLTNVLNIVESTEDTAGLMSAEHTKKLNGIVNDSLVRLTNPNGDIHDANIQYNFETYKIDTREWGNVTLSIPRATKDSLGLIDGSLVDRLDSLVPYVVNFDNPDEPTGVGPFPQYADIYNYYIYNPVTKTQYSKRFYLPIADENFPGVITAEMYKELLTTANQSRVLETFVGEITAEGYNISGVRRSGEHLNTITVPLVDTLPGLVTPEKITQINSNTERITNLENKETGDVTSLNTRIDNVNNALITSVNNLNQVITDSVNALNQNMVDGFNTINGGINNEIRPALENLETNKVPWTEYQKPGDDIVRKHIVLENHSSLFGASTKADIANLIMMSKWDKVDIGSAKYEVNLNGSATNPTYNDTEKIMLYRDMTAYVPWTNVERPSGLPNRSIVLDNDSGIYAKTNESVVTNILRLNNYNVVELGSPNNALNLNTSETRPTVNTDNYVAYLSDVEDSWSWYEGE